MNDADLVGRPQALRDLRDDLRGLTHRQSTDTLEPKVEALTFEALHHDVGRAVLHLPLVKDLDDVRALDLRGDGGLALEARDGLFPVRDFREDEFDGHFRLERQVLRQPHGPHRPLANRRHEADVGGHHRPGFKRHTLSRLQQPPRERLETPGFVDVRRDAPLGPGSYVKPSLRRALATGWRAATRRGRACPTTWGRRVSTWGRKVRLRAAAPGPRNNRAV